MTKRKGVETDLNYIEEYGEMKKDKKSNNSIHNEINNVKSLY